MMQNPEAVSSLQHVLSDPVALQGLTAEDPSLFQLFQMPEIQMFLQRPELYQLLSNPQSVQSVLDAYQQLGAGTSLTQVVQNLNLDAIFSNVQQPATSDAPAQNQGQSDFSEQLRRLQDMGFNDVQANLKALQETNGNVEAAIDRLI